MKTLSIAIPVGLNCGFLAAAVCRGPIGAGRMPDGAGIAPDLLNRESARVTVAQRHCLLAVALDDEASGFFSRSHCGGMLKPLCLNLPNPRNVGGLFTVSASFRFWLGDFLIEANAGRSDGSV